MTTALITGGARGIGRAITERLQADGYDLLLVDIVPEVHDTAIQLGATAVQADIASPEGVATVRNAVIADGRPLKILVNNAGITRDAIIHKMTEDQFRSVIRVNLGATIQLTESLADILIDGGRVVNLSSRAQLGNVGQFNYGISKTGIIGCTRAHALALAPKLTVNAVAPGFVESAMTDAMPDEVRERIRRSIPVNRAGTPNDIAEAVAWLASDAASYVNGQVIYLDGGRSFAPTAS